MKIGLFDSGLGGLIITHSLIQALPQYDYLYLGDTARVPYGNRSPATVHEFTRQAVEYLFAQDCALIIVACNTASAEALRRIQREYLPTHYPDRRVLGVLIPAAEAAIAAHAIAKTRRIGVLATRGTITSGAFDRELHKLDPHVAVISSVAPLLVPLIENNGLQWASPILDAYLKPLTDIDTLILGCTHYPYLKKQIQTKIGKRVRIVSQDEVIPAKLTDYLQRHPEIEQLLAKNQARRYEVTDLTDDALRLASELFGSAVPLTLINSLDDQSRR